MKLIAYIPLSPLNTVHDGRSTLGCRVELAFENHRWFDLLRTGRAIAVMQAHAAREKNLKSYLVPAAYTTIRLTCQYPRREVQLTN